MSMLPVELMKLVVCSRSSLKTHSRFLQAWFLTHLAWTSFGILDRSSSPPFSSSSAFQDCPQTSGLLVLMKLVVCSRSSLETRDFLPEWLLGASAVTVLPCTGGRTAEHAVGFCGPAQRACLTRALDNCVWQTKMIQMGTLRYFGVSMCALVIYSQQL